MNKIKIVHQLIETSNLDISSERNSAMEELNSSRKLTTINQILCATILFCYVHHTMTCRCWKVPCPTLSKFDWTHWCTLRYFFGYNRARKLIAYNLWKFLSMCALWREKLLRRIHTHKYVVSVYTNTSPHWRQLKCGNSISLFRWLVQRRISPNYKFKLL